MSNDPGMYEMPFGCGDYVLYADYAKLEEALRDVMEEAVSVWCQEDCDWPCPENAGCKLRKAINRARRVLGDDKKEG